MNSVPKIIFLAGVDGCGKTTLACWLNEYLASEGINASVVWSRFNNYFSKPLLALTRLTGHNYRKTIDGVKFGFHDFEGLHIYNRVFVLLQAIDVNIATYFKIQRPLQATDVLVCERGPWDTLVDVMADTGIHGLPDSLRGGLYTASVRNDAAVFMIRRDLSKILTTRPELVHDYKLKTRMELYAKLARKEEWCVIDNNQSLEHAKEQIASQLKRLAGKSSRG